VNRAAWFLSGALTACLAAGACALLLLGHGLNKGDGFSARAPASGLERRLAHLARSAAMPARARNAANPVPDSPQVESDARAHFADHCAVCHANDGGGDTVMGKRTWPPAPDMRLPATQNLSDGELFYVIQNGVRFTAMPGWGSDSPRDTEDSWKLVHFIRHLPHLTAEEKTEMQRLNPKSPDEREEEQQEEKFLKGEDINETQAVHEHHHH
jgi:mono/diheme cytochrome c family protein